MEVDPWTIFCRQILQRVTVLRRLTRGTPRSVWRKIVDDWWKRKTPLYQNELSCCCALGKIITGSSDFSSWLFVQQHVTHLSCTKLALIRET